LPVAAGANGQPPMPPMLASSVLARRLQAPPRHWQCRYCACCESDSAAHRGPQSRARASSALTWAGTPTPIVSAKHSSHGSPSRGAARCRARAAMGTSPSNGQPNDVEIVTWARTPAARAAVAISSQAAMDSWCPTLLIATVEGIAGRYHHADLVAARGEGSIQAAAIQHQAGEADAVGPVQLRSSASASAICGTLLGLTKLATSMRRTPALPQTLDQRDLDRSGHDLGSICRPSRGPTSSRSIARLHHVHRAHPAPARSVDPIRLI
jgi:hypothetical protein